MSLLALAAAWFAIGALAVFVMRRRGHDTFAWTLLFIVLGPLAIPLAVSSDRHRPPEPAAPPHDGGLDVLANHDGSADATAALEAAISLLGNRVTSLTLTAVVDLEAASTVRGRELQREAQERLDALAHEMAASITAPVDTVVLFGEPRRALQEFASAHGYELIVAGSQVAARSRLARVHVARKPESNASIPVLIGPAIS